jgi:hypothetical protein
VRPARSIQAKMPPDQSVCLCPAGEDHPGRVAHISLLRSESPVTRHRFPWRLDLDNAALPRTVVAKTRPRPILWLRYQPASHRVAVHIFQLLDALAIGKDIEVVPHPHRLQGMFESLSRGWRPQMRLASITTEGDKVKITGLLIADERPGHPSILPHVSNARRGAPSCVPLRPGPPSSSVC